jgi:hypothetical protein
MKRAVWITVADALTLALLALAALIQITGGVRWRVWGVTISLTGPWRPLLGAAIVAGIRHAVFRGDSLWQRVMRRYGRLGDPYLAGHAAGRLTLRELTGVTALMAAVTLVMTWPQVRRLDAVNDLGDPLFGVWRLAWVAHQIVRDPLELFHANLYYPSRFTLAYSDAMVLPGLLTAPFFWLGIPTVLIYNATVLATFVLAGLAMYLLVRSLTNQPGAALVAGLAFAFYPFRFQHSYQMELLWVCWTPLALWAVHRTLAGGRWRDGLTAGAAFAGQMASCVYFGLFLAAYLVPVGGTLAAAAGRLKRNIAALAAGAVLAAVVLVPLLLPYANVRRELGERSPAEIEAFSSRPQDYLVAQKSSVTWGRALGSGRHGPEDAFPGVLIVVLALVALWPPLSAPRVAYAAGLIFAFDVSLGSHGHVFPVLYRALMPFRGLRAPGRMSMFVGLSLAVLAGYGVARLTAPVRRAWARCLIAAVASVLVLAEARTTITLEQVPPPHDVYRWFEGRPAGVLAELPASEDQEALFTYYSTVHWQRIINGYSGAVPPLHEAFKRSMATFPDAQSMQLLRDRGADFVLVHEEFYGRAAYRKVVGAVAARSDLLERARAVTGGYEARLYQIVR